MAYETIYSHSPNYLSWKNDGLDDHIDHSEDTQVTNSYAATVYWKQGAASGSISSPGNMTCYRDTSDKTWEFSESNGGTIRITLTVTGSGGTGPQK
jgi:hypothetical protein